MGYSTQLINECFAELEKMAVDMKRKQWSAVLEVSEQYSSSVARLRDAPEFDGSVTELERLSLLHRRYMRQLSQHMSMLKDDVTSLDHGINRLHHASQILKN